MHKQAQLIYILPNLFTAASIFSGIVSIIEAIHGNLTTAAWLIPLALLFDGLDGRIARLTGTSSRFGVEFDSLADIVSFGVAPALLLYLFAGESYGRFGILVSALYVIFGAIRLARFNISSAKSDPNVFIGLPIPTAALFIAMWVVLLQNYALYSLRLPLLIAALLLSLLMVSNVRYPSFKKVQLDKPMVFKTMIVLLLCTSLLYLFSSEGFALIVTLYTLYGPLRAVKRLNERRPKFKR